MSPFRSDVEALEARHAALQAEVADRVRARDEAAQMLAEARARDAREHLAARATICALHRRRVAAMLVGMTVALATVIFTIAGVSQMSAQYSRAEYEQRSARVMAQLEAFTDQICACRDSACVGEVNTRMTAWASELARSRDAGFVPDPAWAQRSTAIARRMGACMTAFARPAP